MTVGRRAADALAAALSLYAVYWVITIVDARIYRTSFLLLALSLAFLRPRGDGAAASATVDRPLLVMLTVIAFGWPLLDAGFPYRAAIPTVVDVVLGCAALLLVLEAARRTTGVALPVTALLFIVYAYVGPLFDLINLDAIAHRGYSVDRLVGTLYMTLDGIFGVPLDVAATYVILFAVFGAVLEHSGAGAFFVDWSLAATARGRGAAAPARGVTVAGFLLGTVSGSGVATTVSLASIAWPVLRRAGFSPDIGGAMLSAAGIGALLSPPTLGAAAFLIAEFLEISYLQVVIMSIVPMLLYYLSVLIMIEIDSRRTGMASAPPALPSLATLTRQSGYHFLPLAVVIALLVNGVTAFRAVVWATLVAIALSFVRRPLALRPRRLYAALATGGQSVIAVVATTAVAGIIVGVVSLTGLGLKLSGIIVTLAGGQILPTVVYAAVAVWLLGLAVPVTASYIIGAVIVAPTLIEVGVAPVAAHMFIFYYAVLSEVSPPTALSPFAAAAITGGSPIRTTILTWRYALPAFVVPFAFTIAPQGLALLQRAAWEVVAVATISAALGVALIALAVGGWFRGPASVLERVLAGVAGACLLHPDVAPDLVGLGVMPVIGVAHLARRRRAIRRDPSSAVNGLSDR